MASLHELWPPAGVAVRTPRVVLRWPSDDDLVALAEVAAEGVHDESDMPFLNPWTRGTPAEVARNVLRWHWRQWAEWRPTGWEWPAVAVVDDTVVGMQAMEATDFGIGRTVATGSWLGRAHQGRGLGKEMRAAVLHLAFAGLGAQRAETAAFADNSASLAVTCATGYRPNGERVTVAEGRSRRELHFVLDRRTWLARQRDDIELMGVAEARTQFGLVDDPSPPDAKAIVLSG